MRLGRQVLGGMMLFALLLAQPASAFFHLAVIDEVLTSYNGDPNVQFIEIRMLGSSQNIVFNTVLAVFDGKGNLTAKYLVPDNVANAGAGVRWIIGTTAFQSVMGLIPDFIMPPILPPGGGMICWGAPGVLPPEPPTSWDHTDVSQYVDCVAYGLYSGPTNAKVGTPTTLTADHHSLQRSTSTHDNSVDFVCGASITPQNNNGATVTFAPTAACSSAPSSTYDAAIMTRRAVNLTLAAGVLAKPKSFNLHVRNIGTAAHVFGVVATTDCPAGVILSGPDFVPKTAALDTTATLGPGQTKTAKFTVTVSASAFTNFNHHAPSRCTMTFTASEAALPLPDGSFDATLSNNSLPVELNITDRNDPDLSGNPESYVKSAAPKTIGLGSGVTTKTVSMHAVAGNADASEAGHSETLSVDFGTCALATFATPDFSGADGASSTIAGGTTKGASILTTANAGKANTTDSKSPTRCIGTLTVSGPSDDVSPRDPSNNTTHLVVDVIDGNDF